MHLFGVTNSVIKSTVFEDNNGDISTATAVKMTPRTKHIAVKYHFFKSHINVGTGISLAKIDKKPTESRYLYGRTGASEVRGKPQTLVWMVKDVRGRTQS
jgi:hypothetical protein